jgi:hypothetical protein
VALDQVRDHLGVGLGGEHVAVGGERLLQLAVVLHDPVQDDGELVLVTARQRMGVLLADAAVRGPARVPEARGRNRAVRPGRGPELLEVADRAHVVEAVVLPEGDARRVVAAVLQALETLEKQVLAGSRPDVSDDPAHPSSLLPAATG